MLSHTTHLISKIDPLKYFLSKATLIGRLAKWVMILRKLYIEYVERKYIKGHEITYQLVETPLMDHQLMHIEFLDESILLLTH